MWSSWPIKHLTGSVTSASWSSPSVNRQGLMSERNLSYSQHAFINGVHVSSGSHPLAKHVASFDGKFNNIFMDTAWRELFCRTERPTSGKKKKKKTLPQSAVRRSSVTCPLSPAACLMFGQLNGNKWGQNMGQELIDGKMTLPRFRRDRNRLL